MEDLTNRSRYRVRVKNRKDLTALFPFNRFADVVAYVKKLEAQHLKPYTDQLDESWLVRIREKGHKPVSATFKTREEAEGSCVVTPRRSVRSMG
jgi:hypothetical protein